MKTQIRNRSKNGNCNELQRMSTSLRILSRIVEFRLHKSCMKHSVDKTNQGSKHTLY